MRKISNRFIFILASSFLIISPACTSKKERIVHRSFYYWKSVFRLTTAESSALNQLNIENLYIKFFDVVWNDALQKAEPAAQIGFSEPPPFSLHITPVVFITNETLQQSSLVQVDSLASNIGNLLAGLFEKNKLNLSQEIQLDCDWTKGTKEKYFRLLQSVKKLPLFNGKILSVTVRLHQLKYISENGIPPADKGLLMCYNMGNLRHPETENSIIDPAELKKYISQLQHYPLPLDVAFPVFDWWVWFKRENYKGLIHADRLPSLQAEEKKIVFQNDTVINGYTFEKGDWLRYENSPAESIEKITRLLRHKLQSDTIQVILYHLDQEHLAKYKTHELESLFDGLR